jgi:hypothetical protein
MSFCHASALLYLSTFRYTRSLLVAEAEPTPEAAVEEKREAELAADEEDMDDLLKGRGGRRKKKK